MLTPSPATLDILNHLWQSTAAALAVLALLTVSGPLSARTRRTLGWMGLAKFALPFGALAAPAARLGGGSQRWLESPALTLPASFSPGVAPAAISFPAAPSSSLSLGLLLGAIWGAGAVVLFGSWLWRGLRVRRRLLASAPRCVTVDDSNPAGVAGIFSPVIVLPRDLERTLAPAELEAVLLHELVHLQRRDNLWAALQAMCVSALWFHPLAWLLNRQISLETEKACDERVLELTHNADAYAAGIVKCIRHSLGLPQPGLAGATTPPIVSRMQAIFAYATRRDRPWARVAILVAATVALALSGQAGAFATPARAAEAAPPTPASAGAHDTLSVDFPDEDARNIIRNVANLFNLNVVIPDTLKGKVTIKLRDVTWRQIFHVTLEAVGHTFVEEGGRVSIAAKPASTATPAPASQDRQLLEALAQRVQATGTLLLTGKPSVALNGGARVYVGEKLTLDHQGAAHDLTVVAIDHSTITLRLRGEELRYPLRPGGPTVPAEPIAASAAGGTAAYELRELDKPPRIRFQARPKYPFAQRRDGAQGGALIDFIVDANGDVTRASIVNSSHEDFGRAAEEAVRKWKYHPGEKDGRAVHARMQVPIYFTLEN
jgi:TonB family protein